MTNLDELLEQLGAVDNQLAGSDVWGDAGRWRELLEQRAELVRRLAGFAGTTVSEEQWRLLRQSERAGNALLRHLGLSRHLLERELEQNGRQQRLWGAIAGSGIGAAAGGGAGGVLDVRG